MDIKTYLDIIYIYKIKTLNPSNKTVTNILLKNNNIDAVSFNNERYFYFIESTNKFKIHFDNCDIIKINKTNISFYFEINNIKIDSQEVLPIFLFDIDNIYIKFIEEIKDTELVINFNCYKLNKVPLYEFNIYNKKGVFINDKLLIKDKKIKYTENESILMDDFTYT